MARRRRSKKYSADELVFSAVVVIALSLLILPFVWKIVISLTLVAGIGVYIMVFRRRIARLRSSGMLEIDRMSGAEFEERLWLIFRDLGYTVQATPKSGDWGADLVLTKDGVRTVVQAKRYSKPVGLSAVQEAVTARAKYNCTRSIVVTNNFFTRQAQDLAFPNQTELWDRDRLTKELMRLTKSKQNEEENG